MTTYESEEALSRPAVGTGQMVSKRIFEVNGISILAPTVDVAIALYRANKDQFRTLILYEQDEIDISRVQYTRSVWVEE